MPVYLSLGAGVQSSALALMAADGVFGVMPDAAIFADTHGEPQSVYRWLDWIEPRLPFPVWRVSKGSLERAVLTPHTSRKGDLYYKTAIPFHTLSSTGKRGRISHRTCTRDYKIVPILRRVRQEIGAKRLTQWRLAHVHELKVWRVYQENLKALRKAEKQGLPKPSPVPFPRQEWGRMQANALVEQWLGISIDEIQRAKPSRDPWIRMRWPLIETRKTRLACLDWMRDKDYPEPPRSACWFCPFRSNAEWRRLRDHDPDDFARAIALDHKSREMRRGTNWSSETYLHKSCAPLTDIDLRSDEDRGQLMLWNDECAGVCGV